MIFEEYDLFYDTIRSESLDVYHSVYYFGEEAFEILDRLPFNVVLEIDGEVFSDISEWGDRKMPRLIRVGFENEENFLVFEILYFADLI